MEKSCELVEFTTNVTVVEWVRLGLAPVPVIVRLYVPADIPLVFTVSAERVPV